jgi:hypothetical protein
MKVSRLSVLLKNCLKRKFRREFSKYLKSLDFEEFNYIYDHYSHVLGFMLNKYMLNKPKFLSKRWFKYKILYKNFEMLFNIFFIANPDFIKKSHDLLREKNKRASKLIGDIVELQTTLLITHSKTVILTSQSTQDDLNKFFVYLVSNMYNTKELEKLTDELKELKKNNI